MHVAAFVVAAFVVVAETVVAPMLMVVESEALGQMLDGKAVVEGADVVSVVVAVAAEPNHVGEPVAVAAAAAV
jgi:hypothetical protein